MELIREHKELIAWLLLWMWIALTIFILAYSGTKSVKVYVLNMLLLAGSLYLFFGMK
jgi:hypothetical protein